MEKVYEGNEIYFEHLDLKYLSEYLRWFNDPSIYKFIGNSYSEISETMERRYVLANQDKEMFSIIDKDTGNIVGIVGFNWFYTREIGMFIGTEYHGLGYGKKALALFIEYAFQVLGVNDLKAIVFSNNTKTLSLCKSFGFEITKVVPYVVSMFDEYVDDVHLTLKKKV